MPFLGKNRLRREARKREIERLRAELATYRHAFETTAADRDRLLRLLERTQAPGAAPTRVAPEATPPVAPGANVAAYGPLWGRVADAFEKLAPNGPIDDQAFEAILRQGGFAQFTMYTDRAFLEHLVDWQVDTLAEMGARLEDFPDTYRESDAMPAHLRLRRAGRPVSADFLRLLTYAHVIDAQLAVAGAPAPRLIVEIGSGYGGLARLLKLRYPNSTVCLIDLAVCLRAAEHYLRSSLPDARMVWADGAPADLAQADIAQSGADFLLVPAEHAHRITGQAIDLAINVWSFGEMPNAQIRGWFDFIQKRNATARLFLLNHVMAAITLDPGAVGHHAGHYGWLRELDAKWRVQAFEIDPAIERPPMVRHKHRGLMLFVERLLSDEDINREKLAAGEAARALHGDDWVRGSLRSNRPDKGDPSAARRAFLTYPIEPLTAETEFVLDQFSRGLHLWRPDIDRTRDGAFFRLWNDVRVNEDPVSLRLLRIWLHLQWRPALVTPRGQARHVLFREELQYGLAPDGTWADGPCLRIPDWIQRSGVAPDWQG